MGIFVEFKRVGVDGLAVISDGLGVNISMSADEVRRLYYGVLGIRGVDLGVSLVEYVCGSPGSVDLPEDVLRVERWLECH